jgi:hypothetical protein
VEIRIMAYPKIKLNRREIILLNGFERHQSSQGKVEPAVVIDKRKLEAVAAGHSDAVAFGYVRGRWMPAA